jgi:hypothetical protein
MPQASTPGQHCPEDDQIGGNQQFGDRYLRYTPVKEFVERLHWPWTGFSRAVIMHEMDETTFEALRLEEKRLKGNLKLLSPLVGISE